MPTSSLSPSVSGARVAAPLPPNPIALRLAYAGLLPFVLGGLLALLVREEVYNYVALGLSSYAAVVIAFLGAIHWGLAMRASIPSPVPYAWGAVPAVVAAIAGLMPAYAGLVIHGLMLVACYLVDRRLYPGHGVSSWLTLRFRLTVVAALCCFLAAARF